MASKPNKPAVPPVPVDARKLIKSVDAAKSSVVIQYMRDKTLHAYAIDEITVFKVNNVSGKVADIKPGMVVVDFLERDAHTLDSLTLTGYGETPAAAKPKPKLKPKPTPPPPPPPPQT